VTTPPIDADVVVVHGTLVTLDDHQPVVPDGLVAVARGRLAAVGPTPALLSRIRAEQVVDAEGGIVLPGLVNLHTHLGMTLLRGVADDLPLDGFLERVWAYEGRSARPEPLEVAVEAAVVESQRSGVTTALDMYLHDQVARKVAERLRFRLVTGPTLMGPRPFAGGVRERLRGLADEPPGFGLAMAVGPHSTYTVAPEALAELAELLGLGGDEILRSAGSSGPEPERSPGRPIVVHVHAAETAAEVAEVRRRHGGTPIEVLDRVGLLGPSTVLAHAVVLEPSDIELVARRRAHVAHCPMSNAKLASGIAPIVELLAAGVNVGLGTDGPASSNDLGLLPAMRLAGLLQKLRPPGDAGALPARSLVEMATLGGARALGLADEIGSLEVGKRADLVVMDGRAVAAVPVFDPFSSLVYALGKAEVRHVFIEGTQVVADGRATLVDEGSLAARLAETAAAVVQATEAERAN